VVAGSTVYAVGFFQSIGGQSRNYIAALDASTGAATAWDPNAGYAVYALAVDGSTVYATGDFITIGGQPRAGLAALDAATGAPTAWDLGGSGSTCLLVNGGTIYLGGFFTAVGSHPQAGIAALSVGTVSVPGRLARPALELAQNRPNPAGASTTFQFTLPEAGPVTLAVFDLQGRRVASPLDRQVRPAGAQAVGLRTAGLASGVYLCRLEAMGRSVTRRMLVLR